MIKPFATPLTAQDHQFFSGFFEETPSQAALRRHTETHVDHPHMMSTQMQMAYIQWLMRSIEAKRAIEVGVFTGYGSLSMALALPPEGTLIACDQSDAWPSIGIPYWQQAGVIDRICLEIAPATDTLQTRLDEGAAVTIDFMFIDADKIHYPKYAEYAFALLQSGGMMVFDNVMYVHQRAVSDQSLPATRAIGTLLKQLHRDPRGHACLVPIAEGMLMVQKK